MEFLQKRKESIVVSLFLPVICVYERALVYNSIQRVPSYPLHSSRFFRVGREGTRSKIKINGRRRLLFP